MMKKIIFLICFIPFAVYVLFINAYSQSIFLKNGSIVEGKIVHETDAALTIMLEDEKMSIPRSAVIRIVYDNEYKQRVSIILMDGRTINGHVVEEGKGFYILRKELISTEELRISKKKVNGILKDKGVIVQDKPAAAPAAVDPPQDTSEFPGLAIWTLKKAYKANEAIQVKFKNTPAGRYDYISLAKIGSEDNDHVDWQWINGQTEGELNFKKGLPAGKYEVRVHLHYSRRDYKASKRYPFTVSE